MTQRQIAFDIRRAINGACYLGEASVYGICPHGLTSRIIQLRLKAGEFQGKSIHSGKWFTLDKVTFGDTTIACRHAERRF